MQKKIWQGDLMIGDDPQGTEILNMWFSALNGSFLKRKKPETKKS